MCTINKTEGLSFWMYISSCVILDSLKSVTILDHFHVQQDCTSAVRGTLQVVLPYILCGNIWQRNSTTRWRWSLSHPFFLENKNTEANTHRLLYYFSFHLFRPTDCFWDGYEWTSYTWFVGYFAETLLDAWI